jgi:hypothetical protein
MGREKDQFKRLLKLLPEGWEEKARELGALQRAREIKTPEELLRLVLLYLTEGKSFAGTGAITALSGETSMSKVAVFKRVRNSGLWLQWLCEHVYRRAGLLAEKPRWLKGRNILLTDGSEDVRCGERKQYFMLHYCIDLFTLAAREFLMTDMKTGEKLANFQKLGKDDIVVADRAYGTPPGVAYLKRHGAGYVLRIKGSGFTVFNGKKEKTDLLQRFSGLKEGECADTAVWCVIDGVYEPVRVCALRKDRDSERKGMKRLVKTYQRKSGGKPVSKLQKEYNKYIMVITSLGKNVSPERVLELYRARWQIEIAFKRLKSIFRYNEMPARKPENIRTWFYGKLLLAALCETMVNTGRFPPSEEGPPHIRFAAP